MDWVLVATKAYDVQSTAPWLERKGLEWIKAALFDDPATIARLAAKFRYSQQFMQDDPWAKRAAGEDAELHQHLAEVRPLELTS